MQNIFDEQINKRIHSKNITNITNKKFIKFQINNFLAFSLIELSIVLIIIGLLVVGITGGASLIESAKITNFISTMREWQNDVYTFYSLKNRLPGNLDDSYYIGTFYNNNYDLSAERKYKVSDFGINDYDGLGGDAAVSYCAAFWLDLYLAKVTDFKPLSTVLGDGQCPNGSAPSVFSGNLRTIGPKTMVFDNNNGKWPPFRSAMKGIYFAFNGDFKIQAKIFYNIDKKIDDGQSNTGIMRGFCYRGSNVVNSYQEAISNGYKCNDFYYKLLDYNML